MNEVIPGILEREWSEIERKLKLVKPFARTVHLDIIDGKFAENTTFLNPEPFKQFSRDFFFELHMMVEEPISFVKPWADAGIRRFIGHVEKMSDQAAFLKEAKEYGEAGLAIDGPTSLEAITVPFAKLETLLFMSINAGFSGQGFNNEFLIKIQKAKEMGFNGICEVDGGINESTIIQAKEKGVRRFVSTSFLFGADNIEDEFNRLTGLIF